MKTTKKKSSEFNVEVMGRMVSREEADDMAVEMILADLSSALAELQRRGTDRRILNDTIINSLSRLSLSHLVTDIERFKRQ